MKKQTLVLTMGLLLSLLAVSADAQTYKCKDADGKIRFSDRVCKDGVALTPTRPSTGIVTPERKAESDARIQKDNALANTIEQNRVTTEQAGKASQDQQVQSSQAVTNGVIQERVQKSSTATSILPPAGANTIFTPAGQ